MIKKKRHSTKAQNGQKVQYGQMSQYEQQSSNCLELTHLWQYNGKMKRS